METVKTTVETTTTDKTSGWFKIKEGLQLQAEGTAKIIAGFGKEIQGITQLPLDAVEALGKGVDKVKALKDDIKAEMKKKDEEDIRTVDAIIITEMSN